jgi:hypothetical protein
LKKGIGPERRLINQYVTTEKSNEMRTIKLVYVFDVLGIETVRRTVGEEWRGSSTGRVQRKGIPMTILAIRKAVGPYNPFARSLIIEARSSRYAGIYATAYLLAKT